MNSLVETTISMLENNGFNNIKAIEFQAHTELPINYPIHVINLSNPNSNYTILALDGTKCADFRDDILVAVEDISINLLEAINISQAPKIYGEREAELLLKKFYPDKLVSVLPEYYWKLSTILFNRFSVARKFTIDGREQFLLPNGSVVNQLMVANIGGA